MSRSSRRKRRAANQANQSQQVKNGESNDLHPENEPALERVDERTPAGQLSSETSKSSGRAARTLILVCILIVLVGLSMGVYYRYVLTRARMHSQNQLMKIGLAMHSFNDRVRGLPPTNFRQLPAGKMNMELDTPGLSWRVALLPGLGHMELYNEFHLSEPWDSPHNKKLLAKMPNVYRHPLASEESVQQGLTHYQVFVHDGAGKVSPPFRKKGLGMSIVGITASDGTSNTLMVVEAASPVPWTKPADLEYSADEPIPKLGSLFPDGFNFLMCDGSVHFIRSEIDEQILRRLITSNDGEVVSIP